MLSYFNQLFDEYSFLFEANQLFLYFKQELYKLSFYDFFILEINLFFLLLTFYISCFFFRFFKNKTFWLKQSVSFIIFIFIYAISFIANYFFHLNYLTYAFKLMAFYFIIYINLKALFVRKKKTSLFYYIVKFDFYYLFNWIFINLIAYSLIQDSHILKAGLIKIFIFGIFLAFMFSITLYKQIFAKSINRIESPILKGLLEIFYSINWLLIILFLFVWLFEEPLLKKVQKCFLSALIFIMFNIVFFGANLLFLKKLKNNKNEAQLLRIYNFLNFLTKLIFNPLIAIFIGYIWGIDILSFLINILGKKLFVQFICLAILTSLLRLFIILCDVFMHIYLQNRNGFLQFGKRFNIFVNILNVLFKILSYIIFIVFVMVVFEINPSILLSNFWVFTASLTFVFQSLMKDFAMGIVMMFEDTFYIGDEIEVAGIAGQVEEVTLRVLKIRNKEGALVSIPFNKVEIFSNKNREYIFALFAFLLSNNSDIELVTKLLHQGANDLSHLPEYKNKILNIKVFGPMNLAAEGMKFEVKIKILPTSMRSLKTAYYSICQNLFIQHNIEFGSKVVNVKSGVH